MAATPDKQMASDFRLLGVSVEAGSPDEQSFEIWQENMESAALFFSLATQWRSVAVGSRIVPTGLDYAAAAALIGVEFADKAKKARRLMRDLIDMEAAALPVLHEAQP